MYPSAERRRFGRRNDREHAWIVIPGRPRLACLIVNTSPKGAFLALAVPDWMPLRFELLREDGARSNICEIRHTSANGIGVDFVDVACLAPVTRPSASGYIDVCSWMGASRVARPLGPRKLSRMR